MDVQYFGDDKQETTEPIEISNSNLQNSSKNNECYEIEVPDCNKTQNSESQYIKNNSHREQSSKSKKDDAMAEIYYKQLQL